MDSKETVERLKEACRALERKIAALRASHEKFTALFNRNLYCIYIHDLEGNFLQANTAALDLLGYEQNDLPSINFSSLIGKDQLPKAYKAIEEILQTGSQNAFTEYKILRKDGSFVWVETDGTLIHRKGKPYAVVGVARDITERKKAHNALRESEERFRELAELLPETIFEIDRGGNFTFINRQAFDQFGYSPKDVALGLNAFDMICPEDRERAMANIVRVLSGEEIGLSEYLALRKDGSCFPVIIRSTPIVRDGQARGVRGILIDLSDRERAEKERKNLEAQFQGAQRLETIGTLAGGIAHDFNNLLMAIQGSVSLMTFDLDPNHPHYEQLKNIEMQIDRGAKLTTQLLGYARKGKYHVKPIRLNQIIEESSETFGRTRKDITIQRDLEENLLPVEADQGQIEQVLFNLYVNAADAMPGGGKLFIKTANATHKEIKSEQYRPRPGEYVRFQIADTGIGIAESIQQRIFEPFFTTKEVGKGSGLGLASVYGIIKSHAGYIEVESAKQNGATFSIYLPASDKKIAEPQDRTISMVKGSGTLLLVEDESMVLHAGAKLLKKLGYTVYEASDGKQALTIFNQNKATIDLVILDMIMPDMGGGEVYDRLKAVDPEVKVLLSSGYSIDGQATEIMKRGCNGFIQKPFKAEELSEKVKKIITGV